MLGSTSRALVVFANVTVVGSTGSTSPALWCGNLACVVFDFCGVLQVLASCALQTSDGVSFKSTLGAVCDIGTICRAALDDFLLESDRVEESHVSGLELLATSLGIVFADLARSVTVSTGTCIVHEFASDASFDFDLVAL